MSRKFFKTLVMTGVVAMITTGAYAADDMGDDYKFKVKGKIRSYFGQYTSGKTVTNAAGESVDEASYFQEFNEGNIAGAVERGPMKGYFEIESRAGSSIKATMRQITLDVGNGLNVGVGTFKPKWAYAFSWGAGTETSESHGSGFFSGLLTKLESDGLNVEYKAGDHKMGFTMYEGDLIGKTTGSTMQYGALGKFGAIHYRVGGISSTSDDHTGDTTLAHSGTHVGVQYKMDGMAFSFDNESKTKAKSSTTNNTETWNSVQGVIGVGEHEAIVTYGMGSSKDDSAGAVETKTTDLAVVYVIPVAKKADFRIAYGSSAEDDTVDTATTSFAGVGMMVGF
ncbi:MAG: hypothetical protein RRB13_14520 [bacterium]|nr:hypothetical protein [bacterium]